MIAVLDVLVVCVCVYVYIYKLYICMYISINNLYIGIYSYLYLYTHIHIHIVLYSSFIVNRSLRKRYGCEVRPHGEVAAFFNRFYEIWNDSDAPRADHPMNAPAPKMKLPGNEEV